jgi:hypothetical protein
MIESNTGWQGTFIIKTKDKEEIIHNKIMNAALDELIKVLQGQVTDLEVKYLALGSGNTPVTNNDTTLNNEFFRTQFTDITKTNTGELTSLAIVLEAEAIGTIEEIGIFGGSSATTSLNSGVLISRILWHRVKTSSDEIQFTRIDRMVRA